MSREQLLATTFVELADTLGEGFDVLDFLQNLADRAVEIINVTSAGVVLIDSAGRLQLVATTSHAAEVLELFALAVSEGPCLHVARTGHDVINLAPAQARQRWPQFTAAADELGIGAAHVVPLRLRSDVLGALSLFDRSLQRIDADDLAIVRALASVATIGLLQERSPHQQAAIARQLSATLQRRVLLEQAKGMIAELSDLDMDASFRLLLGYSRRTGEPLSATARRITERRLDVAELQTGTGPG